MDAFVDIRRGGGPSERHPIAHDEVIIGRGAKAQISLPDAGPLEPEHLLLAPREDGCWFSVARGARVPALVEGRPFDGGLLAWGSEVELGEFRLRLGLEAKRQKERGKQAVSLPTILALLFALPLIGWLLFSEEGDRLPAMSQAAPPEILAAAPGCPGEAPDPAARAQQLAAAAAARSERYPFDARDGVEAFELYGAAEACLRRAGNSDEAERVRGEREILARQIREDYRTRLLRLERLLEGRRLGEALEESRSLLALLGARDDPYTIWLRTLEKRLALRVRPGT